MRTNLTVLCLVAAFALMTSLVFAGPGATMRIRVPFDFYAGGQQLPAGDYAVEMGSGYLPTASMLTIRALDGKGLLFMVTQAGTEKNLDANHLCFNKYGNKHFLSSVSIRGFRAQVKMLKLEKELRAQIEKERTVITIAQNEAR